MKITRFDPVSGKTNTQELPITEEQYAAWESGKLIQNAMPHLTPSQREFIMTGITEESWNKLFDEK